MNFLKRLFGGKQAVDDEPLDKQKEALLVSPIFAMGMAQVKEDCDELPGAYGDFSTSLTNPIPVNGPVGETMYINRLRARSGVGFLYHRVGSLDSPICEQKIDAYELIAIDVSQRLTLYFSMYHPRRSLKAPEGTHQRAWRTMDDVERTICRIDGFGSRTYVPNFPYGLPEAVEADPTLNSMSAGMGKAVAARVQKTIEERNGQW